MEYRVISGDDYLNFKNEINEQLKRGWKPQGGVSVILVGVRIHYYQALVKD